MRFNDTAAKVTFCPAVLIFAGLAVLLSAPGVRAQSAATAPPGRTVTPAACIFCPQPAYPAVARAAHVQGAVVLAVVVGADGRAGAITPVSGSPLLYGAAMAAVRTWRWRPPIVDGQAAAVNLQLTLNFSLAPAASGGAASQAQVAPPPAPPPPPVMSDIEILQQQATSGVAAAQFELATDYFNGIDVPQDYSQAVTWLRKAADQGNAEAEEFLGNLYFSGSGVPEDVTQSAYWWRKAAVQGNVPAQHSLSELARDTSLAPPASPPVSAEVKALQQLAASGAAAAEVELGLRYFMGNGVPQDYPQAANWMRKAADQGNARAEEFLGNLYSSGSGVPRDPVQAEYWWGKSAAQERASVQRDLAERSAMATPPPASAAETQPPADTADQDDTADDEAEAAEQRQETQNKIDNLNDEIQQLESDAQDADNSADNADSNSNCNSYGDSGGMLMAIGRAGCEAANRIAVANSRSQAAKDRNKADDDRAEIERLQGEEAEERPHRDASFAGALTRTMQQHPQPSIMDTANQEAARMIALGAANDAARAQAAAAARQAAQQRELEQQQEAQQLQTAARMQAAEQQAQQQAQAPIASPGGNSGYASSCSLRTVTLNVSAWGQDALSVHTDVTAGLVNAAGGPDPKGPYLRVFRSAAATPGSGTESFQPSGGLLDAVAPGQSLRVAVSPANGVVSVLFNVCWQ